MVELVASITVTTVDVIVENIVLLDSSTKDVVKASSVGVRAVEDWLSEENNVSEESTVVSEVLLDIEPSLGVGIISVELVKDIKMTDDENVSPVIDVNTEVVPRAAVGAGVMEVEACSEVDWTVREDVGSPVDDRD